MTLKVSAKRVALGAQLARQLLELAGAFHHLARQFNVVPTNLISERFRAKDRSDPHQQFQRFDGLHDEVCRTQVQPAQAVFHGALRGRQQDDRNSRGLVIGANPPAQLETVHPLRVGACNYHIDSALFNQAQGRGPVRCLHQLVRARRPQRVQDRSAVLTVVDKHENARHRRS